MGKIIGTCGHEISKEWWDSGNGSIAYKEFTNDYENERIANAVSYGLVCEKCKKDYEEWGILLYNEDEEKLWMEGKIPYDNNEYMRNHIEQWSAS